MNWGAGCRDWWINQKAAQRSEKGKEHRFDLSPNMVFANLNLCIFMFFPWEWIYHHLYKVAEKKFFKNHIFKKKKAQWWGQMVGLKDGSLQSLMIWDRIKIILKRIIIKYLYNLNKFRKQCICVFFNSDISETDLENLNLGA